MKLRDFILGMIVAMIICSCGRQQNDLTLQEFEVSGDVKSIRTTGYEATEKFGEISEGDVLYGIYYEDVNNLIVFNKDGHIIEISIFNYSGDLSKKSVYVYDGDDKVIKINKYDGDGDEIGRTVFTYNNNKKVTKIVDYDESGKIYLTQKNEWDGDKLTKIQSINEYTGSNYSLIYEYNGNTVKIVEYKNGKPTGEYSECENKKLKKIVTKDFTMSLTFNNKGLCTSIVNGRMINTNPYHMTNGESYTYDYEYDDKDNWIKKIERKKDSQKATRIFVREIEYF